MCAEQLEIALFFPRLTVHSGGVERTLKVVEYGHRANLHFTAFVSSDVIQDREVQRRLDSLERSGLLALQRIGSNHAPHGRFDAAMIPSEFWIPALRRIRSQGIRAPVFIEFHQLPYIGTFDVLKTVGVDDPTMFDLVRFPFVSSRILGDGVPFFAFQTVACLSSVRSLARFREGSVMAVTPVTAKNLASLGYPKKPFVPEIHVGVEPDSVRGPSEGDPLMYDGVYVGRFHPHKGFLDLPLIAARMNKALGRDVKIAVCGSPQFPRHLALFERRVRALGVEKNLVMRRWLSREDLYATIRRSKVLLYPSYVDAFSITVLESLCLGVPVLAYGIDALRMIWAGRKGVYLSPVGNPTALAQRYADLERAQAFSTIRNEMARQAEVLEREFTWERAVEQERAFLAGTAG
jgi:glycosyltransferase involved in cell wall biosynthesis